MSEPSYARNVAVSVIAVAAMSVLALANNIAIARLCGPEGRGVYGVAVAIGALALPIASMGLGQATTWQLGRGHSLGQLLGLARRVTASSVALALLTAVVVAVAWQCGWDRAALAAVIAAGLALPAQVVIELGRGVALGQRRAWAYNLFQASSIVVLLALNLAFAARGPSWVLSNLVLSYWSVAVVVLALSLRTRVERVEPTLTRHTLGYGARAAMVALAEAALLRIDYLIAAPIIGLAALGVYAIADQICHILAWAGLLAGKMLLPEAARDDDGRPSLAKLVITCRLVIAVWLGASILIAAIGTWVITALFGPAFASAQLALLLLLPAGLAKSLHALLSGWLQGRGIQQPVMRASAVAVAVEIAAVAIAAVTLGWLGVALAKTCAHLVQLALVGRALQLHLRESGLAR